ncbi:MAG: type V CRISPR-associated protein Cas12a/Cpf1, partial [Bacteroidales bacterium]|nr:type V CRISPR-associated protein Cas12a/Cpf1 [Bacteroidales bacterium]
MDKSVFNDFTKKYALSKTLKFELRPVGETRENMDKALEYDEKLQTFLKDQRIEDAYQTLKPVFDKIHDDFITSSLESEEAQKIDFSSVFELYKKWDKLKVQSRSEKDDKKQQVIKKEIKTIFNDNKGQSGEIQKLEKNLLNAFESLFEANGKVFKIKLGNEDEEQAEEAGANQPQKKEKNFRKVLNAKVFLKHIKDHICDYTSKELTEETLQGALNIFDDFTTYLKGFNKNRLNYYETKKESPAAVATRIVAENLPRFISNAMYYEKYRAEYDEIFAKLTKAEKHLQLKNPNSGQVGEPEFLPAHNIGDDAVNFSIGNFVNCFSQKQIDKYNEKVANANFLVNLYNQQNPSSKKSKTIRPFNALYKQIGSDKNKDFIESIKNNSELNDLLKEIVDTGKRYLMAKDNNEEKTIFTFINYVENLGSYENIYWSDRAIRTLPMKYFAKIKWSILEAKIFDYDKKKERFKIPQAIQLSDFFDHIDSGIGNREENADWKTAGLFFKEFFKTSNYEKQEIIQKAQKPSEALLRMIFHDIKIYARNFIIGADSILNIKQDDYQKDEIRQKINLWLENVLSIGLILRYWNVKPKFQVDTNFSAELEPIKIQEITGGYNLIRDYLTRKPQNALRKLKLNFEKSSLADGWDENMISGHLCVILKDSQDNKYLATLAKGHEHFFDKESHIDKGAKKSTRKNELYEVSSTKNVLRRMEYKQISMTSGVGGFFRKCFSEAKKYGWSCPNNCLNSEGKIIINDKEVSGNLEDLIDCYKDFLDKYEKDGFEYKEYGFVFKKSGEYKTLEEFFDDVKNQGYKLDFPDYLSLNGEMLNKAVDSGKVYLFEIRNKDNNLKDGGKKISRQNLHSIYWNSAFSQSENRPKLNGGAEIFYRPSLPDKNIKKKQWKGKEIIENYRFSKEIFTFHCSIKLNYQASEAVSGRSFNSEINKKIIENAQNITFLGIDRGEKHLAYYSLINQNGEILDQKTLNLPFVDVNGNAHSVHTEKWFEDKTKPEGDKDRWFSKVVECKDYNDLLDARSSNRDMARKNWMTISKIKELKDGYISQVIRKIISLAVENNAMIILEDLSLNSKPFNQRIEKRVYQKLEVKLAQKLSFLVDKSAEDGEVGSVENALQLAPLANNFKDIEKSSQWGIMLYVRAAYTSQTDPATGWRKTINIQDGGEDKIKKQVMEAFDDFGFDGTDYYFKYTTKYKSGKKVKLGKKWTLYSGVMGKSLDRFWRLKDGNNFWISKKVDVVKILDGIFDDFDKMKSFKSQIADGTKNLKKVDKQHTAWKSLCFAIRLIQNIRNTGTAVGEEDFIQSPVRDENGNHFDSRRAGEKMPQNGDANGAYNIARKGLIAFQRISEQPEKPKLF